MDLSSIFKSLVWDNIVKLTLSRLFLAVPLLGWGPIGFLITWLATYFTDKLFEVAKLTIDLEIIALKNTELKNEYATAAVKLRILARTHGLESDEFKKARLEQQLALAAFIRIRV